MKRGAATYYGDLHRGKPDGFGMLLFPNGNRIAGQFKKGKRHGLVLGFYPKHETVRSQAREYLEGTQSGYLFRVRADGERLFGHLNDGKWSYPRLSIHANRMAYLTSRDDEVWRGRFPSRQAGRTQKKLATSFVKHSSRQIKRRGNCALTETIWD